MINKIECILDAIGKFNGIHDPESECYQIRNPLLIKSFAKPGKHITDDKGRRVFSSLLAGYKAGIFDLDLKIRGKSRAGLSSNDSLENLLGVYGIKHIIGIKHVVSFLQRGLNDATITKNTPLSCFIENEPILEQ